MEMGKPSTSPVELLLRHISRYTGAPCPAYCLRSVCSIGISSGGDPATDVLLNTAKRYRVDLEKAQKAVAQEFAAVQNKKRTSPCRIKMRPNIEASS